jgi:hypothetical protein
MATGRFTTPNAAGAVVVGTGNTTLYTVPTGTYSVFNVSITNTGTTAVTIQLALSAGATPNNADWIEYGTTIAPKGVFERTGLVGGPGLFVVALSTATTGGVGVNATVYGIETSTT